MTLAVGYRTTNKFVCMSVVTGCKSDGAFCLRSFESLILTLWTQLLADARLHNPEQR